MQPMASGPSGCPPAHPPLTLVLHFKVHEALWPVAGVGDADGVCCQLRLLELVGLRQGQGRGVQGGCIGEEGCASWRAGAKAEEQAGAAGCAACTRLLQPGLPAHGHPWGGGACKHSTTHLPAICCGDRCRCSGLGRLQPLLRRRRALARCHGRSVALQLLHLHLCAWGACACRMPVPRPARPATTARRSKRSFPARRQRT